MQTLHTIMHNMMRKTLEITEIGLNYDKYNRKNKAFLHDNTENAKKNCGTFSAFKLHFVFVFYETLTIYK